jgi:phosphate:Na+ symporter
MSRAGSSFVLAFLIGAVLSVVTQSTNSVALLAITLADAGVLTFDQCVMAIYGANVGSSVLTYMLSTGLRGRQRQVAMYQVSFNFVAALVMVPLFYLEVLSGIPLAVALVKSLTGDPTLQLAYIHVVFNIGGAIVLTPFVGLAGRILARRYPPPPEESEARPQYLYDQAVMEPETALDLVELEQRRLAGYLPRLLDIARDPSKPAGSAIASRQQTIAALEAAIDEFLDRLGEVPISHAGYERLNQVLAVSRILDGLAETLGELVRAAAEAGPSPATRRLIDNVVEGLDAVLTTVVEAMGPDGSGEDRILLRGMSGDRSALMRRLREEYLASDASLGAADKMTILTVTNLTERASWLISRLIDALPPVAAAAPRPETAAEAGARSP